MKNIEKYLIKSNEMLRIALERLNDSRRILFVIDAEDRLIGALSDGDVRRWILSSGNLDLPVDEAMNCSPKYVSKGETEYARSLIGEYEILAVPVVDDKLKVVDIIFWNEGCGKDNYETIDTPVIIMAGGKGERLRPYTSIVPKPLIPIGEKPISELVIDSFYKYGCRNFYFTLNYKKNMIKAYYDDLEKDYSVGYVEEEIPLGTGGSLYYLKDDIKATFIVSNCDILLEADYADVLKFHSENRNVITVITTLKRYTIPYGTVKLNKDGGIEALTEKPSNDYLVNTGVYVLEPEVFEYVKDKKFIHLTDIIEKCLEEGKRVGTYPIGEDAWMDMGQFEDMERMKKRIGK